MEEKQIIKNLQGFKSLKPDYEWKENLRNELFTPEISQQRGFLPFFRLAPVLTVLALIVIISGVFLFLSEEETPELAQVDEVNKEESYLVLIENKLNEIQTPENIAEVTDMMKKAEKEIDESANDPKESTKTAQKVANISKRVKEIEEELGQGTKDLRDSADVLTSKIAEKLEQGIENTSKQIKEIVADEIAEFETKTLDNPQVELFNQAKEYYNNNQFELALEKLLEIK